METLSTYLGGYIKITLIPYEIRMSHWVSAPRVEDILSGKTLLDLSDELWDLLRVEEGEEKLILVLRKYPGISKEVQIVIGKDGQMFLNGVLCDEIQLKEKLERIP